MMKNIKHHRKYLLTVSFIGMMALTACQSATTSATNEGPLTQDARLNVALEKAAAKAAMSGQPEESLALMEKIYMRDSDNPDTAVKYAYALRKNGRLNRAALVISPFARDKDNPNAAAKVEFASVQAALGNYAMAEEFARSAIALEPDNSGAEHVLGIALDAQGVHDEAETAFVTALEKWEGDPSMVMNNLGLNLAAQGRFDEAIAVLKEASQIAPYRREIERNLRIVTALNGDPDIDSIDTPSPARKPAL